MANSKANYPAREKGAEAGGLERDPSLELRHTSAIPTPVWAAQKLGPGDQWVTRPEVRAPVQRIGYTIPLPSVMADNQVTGHHDVLMRVPAPHGGGAGAFGQPAARRINRSAVDRPWDYGTQLAGEAAGDLVPAAPPAPADRDKAGWSW